jgi:hypothetical protein
METEVYSNMKTERVSIVVSEAERQRFLKVAQSEGLDESSAVSVAIKDFARKHLRAR